MSKPLVTTAPSIDETFARALAIGVEREAALDELTGKCHEATSTYPDAIALASKDVRNANELAYVSFHLGAFAESQRTKRELLNKLLGE